MKYCPRCNHYIRDFMVNGGVTINTYNTDAEGVAKGTWKISKHNGDLQRYAVCDRCGYQYGAGIFNGFDCIGIKYYNFCPNCGADMREREDE